MSILNLFSGRENYDNDAYFETFEEDITPEKSLEELDIIGERAYNIRKEINKSHSCKTNCVCKVINIQIDLLEIAIGNLKEKFSGKRQKTRNS